MTNNCIKHMPIKSLITLAKPYMPVFRTFHSLILREHRTLVRVKN